MSVDWFVVMVGGVEITIYCSPWGSHPGLAETYEVSIIGKVARCVVVPAPCSLAEIQTICETVPKATGWSVGSIHLHYTDFDKLKAAVK